MPDPTPPAAPAADPKPATPPVDPAAPAVVPAVPAAAAPAADPKPADPKPADPPAPAVPAADPAAPVEYKLSLPKDSPLDASILERTTAFARDRKLSPDDAQRALEFFSQEASALRDKASADAVKTHIDAHLPGGAEWEKQQATWKDAALKDADLGAGKADQLASNLAVGKRVLATFFPTGTIDFLERTGLGSHPDVIKGFVNLGKMLREDQFVRPTDAAPQPKREAKDVLYGGTAGAKA